MKRQRRFLLTLWGLLALSSLVMAQTYSFSGRVTNERRVAIDGAQVLLSASDSLAAMALTDPEGRFRIDGLARGSYRVAVLLAGYNTFERTLEIKAGDERADFLLPATGRTLSSGPPQARSSISPRRRRAVETPSSHSGRYHGSIPTSGREPSRWPTGSDR